MQRRSLITVTAGVILFAVLVLLLKIYGRGTFGDKNTSFAVPSGTEITRIEMVQSGEKLVLSNHADVWEVNDAGEARKSAVSFIIQTLNEIAIKSPVSDDLFESEIIEKGVEPVHIKVWSGRRLVNSFLVYKTGSNVYGNIMKKGIRNKPFIVSIPGYEGSIGSNFNMNELFWLPFNIFNANPMDISSVDVDYPASAAESFRVVNPLTLPAGEVQKSDTLMLDNDLISRYLTYFTWVPFETWAFELKQEEADRIVNTLPLANIAVLYTDGRLEKLTLWERDVMNGGTLTTDTDRAWGKMESSTNLFIVRYFDVDPLLKRKSYFFRQD